MGQSGAVRDASSAIAVLSATDRLPGRPLRVLVCGTSGSGKTTIAGRVSAILDIPHVEIDALFHGPKWQPRDSFLDDVAALADHPAWVTEWQYGDARPLLLKRADLLVWPDPSRGVVMRQVISRTLRRRLRREELWNGNIEPPLRTFFTHRKHIVRWAWSTHHHTLGRVAAARQERPDLPIVRLPNRAAAVELAHRTARGRRAATGFPPSWRTTGRPRSVLTEMRAAQNVSTSRYGWSPVRRSYSASFGNTRWSLSLAVDPEHNFVVPRPAGRDTSLLEGSGGTEVVHAHSVARTLRRLTPTGLRLPEKGNGDTRRFLSARIGLGRLSSSHLS